MEALVKVVSQIHKQWGIDCKAKDFTLAVTRLLQLSIIDRPVDILHPDVWDQCTKALAEDTMSSGSGKNLKAWGRVMEALQKALQEQETWEAARNCLKVSPQLGIAAATQTFSEGTVVENFQSVEECSLKASDNVRSVDGVGSAECRGSEEQELVSKPPSSRSLAEGIKQMQSFYNSLAEEARNAGKAGKGPPPYVPQGSTESERESRSYTTENKEGHLDSGLVANENKESWFANAGVREQKKGGERKERTEANLCQKARFNKARSSHSRRRGERRCKGRLSPERKGRGPREKEWPSPEGKGWGRSPTKRVQSPEAAGQSTSGSESDSSSEDWDSLSSAAVSGSGSDKEEVTVYKISNNNVSTRVEGKSEKELTPLTDWRKIQMACANWNPSATLAFPVRLVGAGGNQRTYSPVNPKDVQAIVKAITDRGINLAMVSTLIDSVFGGDDMLPFDIKQTCRLIFDGAGIIVFKQEWEDNCAKQLALVTGADHPLHGSSLQRLMGTDPTMITPQAQAEGLWAHEVMTTTRAAKEAIRSASMVTAKPSSWSTVKQSESESFTQFVDWLQAALDSSALPSEAKGPVLAECLHQQYNSATKDILRSLPLGSSIADMISHVAKEERFAPIQAAVHTAITSGVALDVPFEYSAADNPYNFLIVLRVLYHQEEEMYRFLEETIQLHKREVITGVTIAMLLGLGATGTATGVSALVTQHQRLSQLQMTIDEDLLRTEKSISSLERSISSLSEVILQNRRGLDLLVMQQGGLCAALREECCFYADHTGVVQHSMAELRERLAQRKREREAQQGWFESWFNQSPWLATLVSTLVGPLTMIVLTLIFGPCILNKLVSFVRSRLEKVDILFVECLQLP
ncbi:hypothetical protein DUI87_20684 [Hirundo rustica rustica]|uniref:Uncharacterized protein n=1 Tax=Hirundo rustica rustica TaxID=333673 RepID=A0A3M0JRZ5_HIRRU|nr:hypothetical protein DUI87_20684 [Hirundo rustica rustica]